MIEISEIKVSLKEGATEQAALEAGMREAARLLSLHLRTSRTASCTARPSTRARKAMCTSP